VATGHPLVVTNGNPAAKRRGVILDDMYNIAFVDAPCIWPSGARNASRSVTPTGFQRGARGVFVLQCFPERRTEKKGRRMEKKKILIIDDESNLAELVKLDLERAGRYEVTVAASGRDGIEKVKSIQFDLVITDFNMPGMDGREVLETIKSMDPRIPVVFFSVYYDENTVLTDELKKKADGLIHKPFDYGEIHQVVERTLEAVCRRKDTGNADGAQSDGMHAG
jgi:CheY-like chemotaxis protein